MLHTLADKLFFEEIERIDFSPKFHELLLDKLPMGWETKISGIWLAAHPAERTLRPHGFKIHLSSKASHAEEVIRVGSSVCFEHKVSFKIARDPKILAVINSKHYPRGNAGKLMTIYPRDDEQFREIIERLHDATTAFEGPYILSDRRYKDTGVVYYRYGEIVSHSKMTLTGRKQSELIAPDGSFYKEDRLPFYRLPPWVNEPFPDHREEIAKQTPHIVGGRYSVTKAIAFSNGGGIYLATDTGANGKTVILKESRPHAAQFRVESGDLDSSALLRHEYDVLCRLRDIPGVIDAHDLFHDWEHTFLVEEYFEGAPLTRFRARSDVNLLPFEGNQERATAFSAKLSKIALQAIDILSSIHQAHVVVGDLSPGNLLVNPDTLEIKLIDFEGASVVGGSVPSAFSARWATSGFRRTDRSDQNSIGPEDDWYALGMILFSMILPIQSIFDFDVSNADLLLDELTSAAGLPEAIPGAIRCLWRASPADAVKELEGIAAGFQLNQAAPIPSASIDHFDDTAKEVIESIDTFLAVTCQPDRTDRLWPSDPESFGTNALSLAYGCGGPLLYLHQRDMVSDEQRTWYINAVGRTDELPPGLYNGGAGVAVLLHLLKQTSAGCEQLVRSWRSELVGVESNIFQGDAGIVMATLQCNAIVVNPDAIELARIAAGRLIERERDRGDEAWRITAQGARHLGYAFGGSGVALALLYLGVHTGEESTILAAREALEVEIGAAIPGIDSIAWGATPEATVSEPYWLHGSSGVGTALVRFGMMLRDERYLDLATQAAESCYSRFTVHPGQFEGMSGIGEFMLDMHQFTGKEIYLHRAAMIAKSIAMFRVKGRKSVGFLGRGLQRLSCDFAYGASGVGAFMSRHLTKGNRLLHDLPFMSKYRVA